MSDKEQTFRQAVEEIECSQCNNEPKGRDCPVRNSCLYGTGRVDRICAAAVESFADGLPVAKSPYPKAVVTVDIHRQKTWDDAVSKERADCQAHVRKECGL